MTMDFFTLLILSFVAAFGGTLTMTLSQEIEMRINRRPVSFTPALAVFKILRLNFDVLSSRMKTFWSYTVHFVYGTFLGFPLALLYFFNVTNFVSVLVIYFLIIWIQGLIIIPLLGIAGPPWTWGVQPILTEIFHKTVYAFSTVIFFIFLM